MALSTAYVILHMHVIAKTNLEHSKVSDVREERRRLVGP